MKKGKLGISLLTIVAAVGCGQAPDTIHQAQEGEWVSVASVQHGALNETAMVDTDCLTRLRFEARDGRDFAFDFEHERLQNNLEMLRIDDEVLDVASGDELVLLDQFNLRNGVMYASIMGDRYTMLSLRELQDAMRHIDTDLLEEREVTIPNRFEGGIQPLYMSFVRDTNLAIEAGKLRNYKDILEPRVETCFEDDAHRDHRFEGRDLGVELDASELRNALDPVHRIDVDDIVLEKLCGLDL